MNCVALETERLRLYVASQAEMEQLIERQTGSSRKPIRKCWMAVLPILSRASGMQSGW